MAVNQIKVIGKNSNLPHARSEIKLMLLLLPALLFANISFGQNTFQKLYATVNNDIGNYVRQTFDGGYILTCRSQSMTGVDNDLFLIRTNTDGDTLWTKRIHNTGNHLGFEIQQTRDSGFVAAGTDDIPGLYYQVFVVRTNQNGDTLWTKTFGGSGADYAYCIRQTPDDGFVICGSTDFGQGEGDVYLIKLNSSGDMQWTKVIGGSQFDWAADIILTRDSGFMIAGHTESFGNANGDIFLIRTDSSGDTLWTRTIGGPSNVESATAVAQTADNGFIITGSDFYAGGVSNAFLLKTDANGNTDWVKSYGGAGATSAGSVIICSDGGFLIGGTSDVFSVANNDVFLLRTDSTGNTVWSRTYGGMDEDMGSSVAATADSGFIIAGSTGSFTSGSAHIYLIKTDSLGNSGCFTRSIAPSVFIPTMQSFSQNAVITSGGTETLISSVTAGGADVTSLCSTTGFLSAENENSFSVFPNPSAGSIILKGDYDEGIISVYDLSGKKVLQKRISHLEQIDGDFLMPGFYLLKFTRYGREDMLLKLVKNN